MSPMAAPAPGEPPGCFPCFEAIELDRIALVAVDMVNRAEIGVIACPEHLARIVLAIELLDEHERYLQAEPVTQEQLDRRIVVKPGVTP
jgi:hypothetical protein